MPHRSPSPHTSLHMLPMPHRLSPACTRDDPMQQLFLDQQRITHSPSCGGCQKKTMSSCSSKVSLIDTSSLPCSLQASSAEDAVWSRVAQVLHRLTQPSNIVNMQAVLCRLQH